MANKCVDKNPGFSFPIIYGYQGVVGFNFFGSAMDVDSYGNIVVGGSAPTGIEFSNYNLDGY